MTKVKFNVPGGKRKEMAHQIAERYGCKALYLGPPTFGYKIGCCLIEKDGTLIIGDGIDDEEAEKILENLYINGFESDISYESETDELKTEISVPAETANKEILQEIIDSKAGLICRAFDIENAEIRTENGKIAFPWFSCKPGTDDAMAYMLFVTALCRLSKELKRVNKTEKEIPDDKYAFRCFLLRLGFIGNEYKAARKILLKNFTGSSAYRTAEEES